MKLTDKWGVPVIAEEFLGVVSVSSKDASGRLTTDMILRKDQARRLAAALLKIAGPAPKRKRAKRP